MKNKPTIQITAIIIIGVILVISTVVYHYLSFSPPSLSDFNNNNSYSIILKSDHKLGLKIGNLIYLDKDIIGIIHSTSSINDSIFKAKAFIFNNNHIPEGSICRSYSKEIFIWPSDKKSIIPPGTTIEIESDIDQVRM